LVCAAAGGWLGYLKSGYYNRDKGARDFRGWVKSTVDAGPAWTLSDSWATNLAGAGGVLGSIVTATGSSSFGSVLNGNAIVAITVLFLIFGGTAALGPLTYGALAKTPDPDLGKTLGYVWGFLSAAAVTLLAVMGELATVALLIWQASSSTPGKVVLVIFVGIGSGIAGAYSVRSLVLFAATKPAPTDETAAVAPARRPRSVLGSRDVSATL
jgi:hypothetical protein